MSDKLEGDGEAVAWPPDHRTLAAWKRLVPGTTLMLAKLDPHGQEVTRYQGRVVRTFKEEEEWIEVEARWTNRSVNVHGLRFETGDLLLERFSPIRPFNVFAVHDGEGDLRGWYANVTHPARLEIVGAMPLLLWHDLYLDIVSFPDGSCRCVDDDELERSGLALDDPLLHGRIRAARDDLLRRFQEGRLPYKRG